METPRSPALVILVGSAAAVVIMAGLKAASSIVGPVFLALVLVIAVNPLRAWLDRRGAPFWVCVSVPLATVIALLLALGAALAVSVAQLAALLPAYTDQFNELLASATRALARYGVDHHKLGQAVSRLDPGQLFTFVEGFLAGLLSASSALLLIVLMLFGMCIDATGTVRQLERLATSHPALVGALRGFARDTGRYLIVSTVFGAVVAVLDTVVLYLFAVPLPLLWGLLAFLTNYIPNIGFVVGLVPPAVLGLLTGGLGTMIWIIVAYSVINFVLQSLVQPKFFGTAVGLSFTLVSISLILWSWVLGPLGAILAVPLTTLARALLIDLDPRKRWLDGLLTSALDKPPKRQKHTPKEATEP
ncbi:AI-2E family transporter [Actinomadura rugatobispora]|uniref:AI-2E family transporter n=1 Tax=Actinomadura rugatobispora TaxID=1994 RepID=A0ABW1AGN8_9ACTN|nr:AI-2E family transporter [Actinomadura rugatobispora]